MAYYAHISNEQYTVADRARLEEACREKDVIETANIASDEYADLREAYLNSFTSETLEGLQSDLNALYSDRENMPSQEDVDAINDAIAAEKEVISAAKETALADMKEKEVEGTEALVTEMATLETSIANTPYIVTHAATGVDEFTSPDGTTTEIDNTLYWEGWYRRSGKVQAVRRMSYNTQGGVHKLGGTPFRKNYAGVGYMYDPVRDAFYSAQPYASWTLNEDTCYWEAPTPRPEGMDWHWNEATLEWVEHPYKRYKSWVYGNKLTSWNGYYEGDEPIDDWFAPIECPDVTELSYSKRLSSYIWNEDTLTWVEL